MPNQKVRDFLGYVKEKSKIGQNGYDSPTKYVPGSSLEEYWSIDKVKDVLSAFNIPSEHPEIISRSFVRIFSILAYIGKIEEIELFTRYQLDDKHLPFAGQPTQWSDSPTIKSLFAEFFSNQWTFCPLEFRDGFPHKRELSPEVILPVTFGKRLNQISAGRDVSIISKVQIHDECNDKTTIPTDTVVFKVYQTNTAVDLFTTEVSAYTSLPTHMDYITRYYGSFVQNNKRTIILEYAPGGTLLHFFQKTRPPNNDQELGALWRALFQLLQALYLVHEKMRAPSDAENWVFSTIHNDIQPANILVFPQSSGQTYDIKFKLADFGTSHLRQKIAGAEHIPAATSDANRMYLAPESCSLFEVHEYARNRVDPTIDVWALGAIFSEMLIWTVWGEEGREGYRERRKQETAEVPVLQGSGYNSCFHDGISRLDVVETIHLEALEHTRRSDTSSAFISDLILDHMLQPKDQGRLDAITTLIKAQDLWRKANRQSVRRVHLTRTPSRPSVVEANLFDERPLNPRRMRAPSDASYYQASPSQSISSPTPIPLQMVPYEMEDQTPYPYNLPTPPSTSPNAPGHANKDLMGYNTVSWLPLHPGPSIATPISPLDDPRNSPFRALPDSGSQFARPCEPFPVEVPTQNFARQPTTTQPQDSGRWSFTASMRERRSESGNHSNISPESSAMARERSEVVVTIEQVYILLAKKNGSLGRRISRAPKKNLSDVMTLPGIQPALSQIRAVNSRDQILLIDDFSSMGSHKDEVAKAARVISYYVKDADLDGMELYFASESRAPKKHSNSSGLESAIRSHGFVSGYCNMDLILSNILEKINNSIVYATKPVSIYVFTDGIWEPGVCHVDSTIARAAERLIKKKALPQQIMIQFIRFGHDPTGIERLRHLDDSIMEKFKLDEKFDIVDTKSYEDHVPDILVGSISRFNDKKPGRTPTEAFSAVQ